MQSSRNRETLLCLDECISACNWTMDGLVTCTVSFGFKNEDGTFTVSPQAVETYSISGPDYLDFKVLAEKDGFRTTLLWPFIDRIRNRINNDRKLVLNENPNT